MGLAVLLFVAGVVVVLLVRQLRDRVLPPLRVAFAALRGVFTSVRSTLLLFGGNAATQVLFAMTLGASLRAYGESTSLANLILINTMVSLFAGLLPIPGGMGVAEAGLTAGLVAVGIPESTAFAAAITHRMVTYYLPPIWGWFAMRWLGQRDYL